LASPGDTGSPVGVVTFHGSPRPNVELKLTLPGGRILAHWPIASSIQPLSLTWKLNLLEKGEPTNAVAGDHWFASLRQSGDLLVSSSAAEKFVLYDAQVPLAPPLKLEARGGRPVVTAGADLHDLTFYLPERNLFAESAVKRTPATRPGDPAAGTLDFSGAQGREVAWALTGWGDRLKAEGFTPAEVNAMLGILRGHALDPHEMTAVYRLAPAELDKLVTLTAEPAPARRVRAGLVVVHGIDPAFGKRIDALVAQLGDPSWKNREAASKALAQMGRLAKPELEAALRSKDPEVVYRAEQLLGKLKQPRPAEIHVIAN
jgi:hypothetical protein